MYIFYADYLDMSRIVSIFEMEAILSIVAYAFKNRKITLRILIFSDSHRDFLNMRSVIDAIGGSLDFTFHLGDHFSDAEALKYAYPDIRLHSVRGNCDYAPDAPNEELIVVDGYKVFLTHGHLYNVKSTYSNIITAAKARNADVCLFGHTHLPDIFYVNKTLFLNPGSISNVRNIDKPTYGILSFTKEKIEPSIVAKISGGFKPVRIKTRLIEQ